MPPRTARLLITDALILSAVNKVELPKDVVILETLPPPTKEELECWGNKCVEAPHLEAEWEEQQRAERRYQDKLKRKAGRPAWRR